MLNKPFSDVVEETGLGKRFTQRGLRRTFNDLARAARVDALVTRSISGHLTEKMQQHYSTVNSDEQRQGIAKVIELTKARAKRQAEASDAGDASGGAPVVLRGPQVVLFEAPRLTKGLVFLSGRRDSNPRRPPWQGDEGRFGPLRTARFLEKTHNGRYLSVPLVTPKWGGKWGGWRPESRRCECHPTTFRVPPDHGWTLGRVPPVSATRRRWPGRVVEPP